MGDRFNLNRLVTQRRRDQKFIDWTECENAANAMTEVRRIARAAFRDQDAMKKTTGENDLDLSLRLLTSLKFQKPGAEADADARKHARFVQQVRRITRGTKRRQLTTACFFGFERRLDTLSALVSEGHLLVTEDGTMGF